MLWIVNRQQQRQRRGHHDQAIATVFPSAFVLFLLIGTRKKKSYTRRDIERRFITINAFHSRSALQCREMPCESVICLKCCIQFFCARLKCELVLFSVFLFTPTAIAVFFVCIDCCLQHLQLFCLNINDINSVANHQRTTQIEI